MQLTTMNDGFQNGGPFEMVAIWNGGPEPTSALQNVYIREGALTRNQQKLGYTATFDRPSFTKL